MFKWLKRYLAPKPVLRKDTTRHAFADYGNQVYTKTWTVQTPLTSWEMIGAGGYLTSETSDSTSSSVEQTLTEHSNEESK